MIQKSRLRRSIVYTVGFLVLSLAVTVPFAFGHAGGSAMQRSTPPANANLKLGKVLFIAACGGCHTLAAAGTKGKRGGDLGQEPSAYAAIVTRIKFGGEGMPAFRGAFPKAQIVAIAAYLAKAAPNSGGGGG